MPGLLLIGVSVFQAGGQPAQNRTSPDELFRTIASLDAALFDSYNQCDLDKFRSFFTSDVEFYHDQSGVTIGTQKLTDSLKANICGKVRRELAPGTLEVYPMHGYGALETGVHQFYRTTEKKGGPTGEAKFIHLWHNKDGAWRIARVVSYAHVALRD